ncbi:shikimate kinase [Qipengyuania spongiae]|uniref:Shikimate kinase n=1 Tax=Qipengyuania spongiae TaxID=2909673 RepID=A0ABY5SY99_9SPHN|nr:shikimate kinase [Qipengyuania spongiae]UVI39140.1 shikimate kinase [Qipengyuania spongiae]
MTQARSLASNPPDIAGIAARLDRPIVLVGLMGTGKSTVGRRLAALLGTGFVDTDEEIERAAARSVSEIFAQFGELHFRDGERRVIARLLRERHGVVATGGGAFVDPATRALVLDRAIAIWLDCDIDTLVERTARRNSRPLLRRGDPRAILTTLHAERAPLYAQAHCRVVTNDAPHHATALRIIEALRTCL